MADCSKSFLSRCIWALSWTRNQPQNQSQETRKRSWPRTKRCHSDFALTEDDCAPLLESLYSPQDHGIEEVVIKPPSGRISQFTGRARSQIRISKSLLAVSLCALLGIISLVPQTEAAPLRSTHYVNLLDRQSIPDRFGNTGNEPGTVSSEDANEVGPDATSSTVTVTATRTVSIVPSSSQLASGSPLSSISAATSTTTQVMTPTRPPPSTLTSFVSSPTSVTSPTSSPPGADSSSPAEPLIRTTPISPFNTATLAGTITGASVLLLLLITAVVVIYKRRKTRQIEEIPIRRSKLGSRLALRVFGSHYDERIARSRTGSRDDGAGNARFTERRRSSAKSVEKDGMLKVPKQTYGAANGPISPSVYSPRLTRISTMTFGSVGGWLDKSVIGRPVPAFTGTPSQLLDAPKPLFAKQDKVEDEKWLGKRDISPPRPARPGSAEPLGRLSGMGYGLGMGTGK